MADKGCNRCKHHKSSLNDDLGLVFTCLNGKQKEHNLWWQNNGHKKDDLDDMPCFEQTEVSKCMDRMHELLDEMLKLAENIKKQ